MKTIQYIFILTSITFISLSCFDDKGNYDYTEFKDITIQGIQTNYAITSYQDTLHITPQVLPAEDSYNYLWTINRNYTNANQGFGDGISKDTISQDPQLSYAVKLPNGEYNLTLKVTNQETGYSVFYNTKLIAQTAYSSGFYILKETAEGKTDVDLHTPKGKLENLLKETTGNSLAGKPTSMGLIFEYCYINPQISKYDAPRALSVCSENDIRVFSLNDFSTIFTYDNLFYDGKPAGEKPLYLYPNTYNIGYLSTAGIHSNYQNGLSIPSSGQFGLPTVLSGNCRPSRHMAVCNMESYIFDELNHRFVKFNFNAQVSVFSEKSSTGETIPYSPNAIPANYQLIFCGPNTASEYNVYALFKDMQAPQKHYLYTLKAELSKFSNPISEVTEIPTSLNFNRASVYAINEKDARIMYFATDNKLYRYLIDEQKESEITLSGFEGGEITYISNRYWLSSADKENNFNYLAIGTYKNGQYKIYFYNMTGGIPNGAPVQILQGEGKAIKVHYNSPLMTDNNKSGANYPCSF